jgi:hypothetical protein
MSCATYGGYGWYSGRLLGGYGRGYGDGSYLLRPYYSYGKFHVLCLAFELMKAIFNLK